MNRTVFLGVVLAVLLIIVGTVEAQSVGSGISVFVPLDMFEGETGSISFEQSLETSFGIGEYLTFPIGFSYNQVYGLSAYGNNDSGGTATFDSDDGAFPVEDLHILMQGISIGIGGSFALDG
jgi:hypothetical protein